MGVLAIIAALLLEQWRPLSDRKVVAQAFKAWADWLERSFNAGESRHGVQARAHVAPQKFGQRCQRESALFIFSEDAHARERPQQPILLGAGLNDSD